MDARKPSAKQARFVQEYLIDLNATAAAARAGYKKPNTQGPRLLVNVCVADAIRAEQAKRAARFEIKADSVLRELAKLAYANMADYFTDGVLDITKLTRDQAAALVEVDLRDPARVKFKLADKRAALVDLGRHLGIFVDKIEHSGKVSHHHYNDMSDAELAAEVERLAKLRDSAGGVGGETGTA